MPRGTRRIVERATEALSREKVPTEMAGPLSPIVESLLRFRGPVKFVLHLAIFAAANYAAYLIRFDFSIRPQYFMAMRDTIPLVLGA